jgi:hypothetical protein
MADAPGLLERIKEVALAPPPQQARLSRLKTLAEGIEAELRAMPVGERSAVRYRLGTLCAEEAERFSARGYAHASEVMTRAAELIR